MSAMAHISMMVKKMASISGLNQILIKRYFGMVQHGTFFGEEVVLKTLWVISFLLFQVGMNKVREVYP